jgi:hypothetical protein
VIIIQREGLGEPVEFQVELDGPPGALADVKEKLIERRTTDFEVQRRPVPEAAA